MDWQSVLHAFLVAAAASLATPIIAAPKQTVCTITVNSADEKEAFRRHLPPAKYQFVELVERGRPDWLASACRAAVTCDVLIVSGHYDGANDFFSDQLETPEFLPVDELERASCSGSCPGLFSQLKEVYLFGCNTLNPVPLSRASAEVVRGLVREGHSLKEAERQLRALNAGHGESSRDRMRQVFWNVPVIYGFSSVAPLGPIAGATLNRHFQAGGGREIGLGSPSKRLLTHFASNSMTSAPGMTAKDPHASVRGDVCQFVDDRLPDAKKLGFVHQLLQRDAGQARVQLDRIERFFKALEAPARRTPDVEQALDAIARDRQARERFLALARDADQPAVLARLIKVAHDLNWLSADERWGELALMLGQLQARSTLGVTEVDLACTLNQDNDLSGSFDRLLAPGSKTEDVPHAAVRACLGSADGRTRTLAGLVSPAEADVQIARAYLRHRPITDAAELRQLTKDIIRMPASAAQVRALGALGRHYVSDQEILDMLVRLFSETPSWPVQTAVAGILIRADRRSIAAPQLLRTLQERRRQAPPADNIVDALIRRLQSP